MGRILCKRVKKLVALDTGWVHMVVVNSPVIPNMKEMMSASNSNATNIRIALFGDSLIQYSCSRYNLDGQLQERLQDYAVTIDNFGERGDTIQRMHDRLPEVLATNPTILVMLWDSDCSDYSEDTLSLSEIVSRRSNYTELVRATIHQSLSHGVSYILLSGPILLGESRPHVLTFSDFFSPSSAIPNGSKEAMLDAYRTLNAAIVHEFPTNQVEYLDLRSIFQSAIPRSWWIFNRWYVTVDGEHPNRLGTDLMVRNFSKKLEEWLRRNQTVRRIG